MAIVGFNFSKINAEKIANVSGNVSINNNLAIIGVKETSISFGKDSNKGLVVQFEYISKYEPSVGKMTLTGDVVSIESAEKVKAALESWEKNKSVSKDIMTPIMGFILNKCSLQAIILSRDINLPAPVPLPKIQVVGSDAAKPAAKEKKK